MAFQKLQKIKPLRGTAATEYSAQNYPLQVKPR